VAKFEPDVVYHLAAISIPADCGSDQPTEQANSVNVGGTESVVDLCLALDQPPRVLFASTCHVYSPVSSDCAFVHEESPLRPGQAYGKTKLAAEEVLFHANKNLGLDVVVARSFQHTGPGQSPRMILPDWATQLLDGSGAPLQVICLDTHLDLSDVRDVVRAYRMLAVDGISGTTYNVGGGICHRSGDILELMLECADSKRDITELQPGRRQHPIADNSRLHQQTGWHPEIPLQQTIIDTLDYWRERGTER